MEPTGAPELDCLRHLESMLAVTRAYFGLNGPGAADARARIAAPERARGTIVTRLIPAAGRTGDAS